MVDIKRIKPEIIRRLDKLLSQYLYDYDIGIQTEDDYILIVDVETDLSGMSGSHISSLTSSISRLARHYDPTVVVSQDDFGIGFTLYL